MRVPFVFRRSSHIWVSPAGRDTAIFLRNRLHDNGMTRLVLPVDRSLTWWVDFFEEYCLFDTCVLGILVVRLFMTAHTLAMLGMLI